MTREEWMAERRKTRLNSQQSNYTRQSKSQEVARMGRLIFLLFDIGPWIYKKACGGEEWALDAWEYNCYDPHEMIIKKATEEGLI